MYEYNVLTGLKEGLDDVHRVLLVVQGVNKIRDEPGKEQEIFKRETIAGKEGQPR